MKNKPILSMGLLVLALFLVSWNVPSVSVGPDLLIAEMEKVDKVKVYIQTSTLSVKKPMAATMLPPSCSTFNIADESLQGYDELPEKIAQELNKAFGTDKFVAGNIADVPTKEVKLMGQTGKMEDWSKTDDKLVALVLLSGTYSFFPGDDIVKTTYTVSGNVKFAKITSQYLPDYFNPMGVGFAASSDFEIKGDCYGSMDKYKEKWSPRA